jgi:hypothetical protein
MQTSVAILPRRLAALALFAAVVGSAPGCVTMFVEGSLEPDTHQLGGFQRAWIVDDPAGDLLVVEMTGYELLESPRGFIWGCGRLERPAQVTFRLDGATGRAEVAHVLAQPFRAPADQPAVIDWPALPDGAVEVAVIAHAAPTQASAFVVQGSGEEPLLFHEGLAYSVPQSHQDAAPLKRAAQVVSYPICVAVDVALIPAYGVAAGVLWLAD